MDELVEEWHATLTEKERALHDLAAIKLKKVLNANAEDGDKGSYFPEYSHAFRAWLKTKETSAK
jgi:hypothetical protein